MKKVRYNLSKESVDELTKRLMKAAAEQNTAFATSDYKITTTSLKATTKVKGLTDVIDRNEELTKTYSGLLDLYGFDNMYDLYIYAKSNDSLPEQLTKRKDYSKLVPVKRKVTRNGKQTEITVYEDPNKGGSQPNEGNNEGRDVSNAPVGHARDFKGKLHGHDKKIHTKDVAKLKQAAGSMDGKSFKDGSDYYLELKGPNGQVVGIIGYSVEGDYLVMDFYKRNGQVNGIAARGFSELIRLAIKKNKGVKVEDDPQARPVYAKFGLEQDGNQWKIDSSDLQKVFGESGLSNA